MYAGFKVNLSDSYWNTIIGNYLSTGQQNYQNFKDYDKVKKRMAEYIGNDIINGTNVSNNWFPHIDSNIFISHSSDDLDKATALSGLLYEKFHITSFIDSYVWGYVNDLLKQIDDKHCRNENQLNSYNYNMRNSSTAHVHSMLSVALAQMIDKTECVFFINTNNSVAISTSLKNQTFSPWIYSEICMTNIIRRRPKEEHRPKSVNFDLSLKASREKDLKISYDLKMDNLIEINEHILKDWEIHNNHDEEQDLDNLYNKLLVPDVKIL